MQALPGTPNDMYMLFETCILFMVNRQTHWYFTPQIKINYKFI